VLRHTLTHRGSTGSSTGTVGGGHLSFPELLSRDSLLVEVVRALLAVNCSNSLSDFSVVSALTGACTFRWLDALDMGFSSTSLSFPPACIPCPDPWPFRPSECSILSTPILPSSPVYVKEDGPCVWEEEGVCPCPCP
jgi:hypothetical protein